MKRSLWIPTCLLALLAAWLLWPAGERPVAAVKKSVAATTPSAAVAAVTVPVVTNNLSTATEVISRSAASTNREFFRLSNTTKTLDQLTTSPRAILLENALIDTASLLDLKIPTHLRATGEPGAYIVQARDVVNGPFRAALTRAGAQIVSYIPNNAYLVQLSAGGAAVLRGDAQVAAVLPFEPYFKLQASLLGLAVGQKPLPPGQVLTLGLFDLSANQTLAQIEKMGGTILASDRSPFGPIVRVHPPKDWIALAQLSGVQRVEPATRRVVANDLARVTMGITTDYYVTNANWLGLSGSNVVVEVNDTGIDASHPDFSTTGSAGAPGANPPTRVTGDTTNSIVDTDGHGTHVAGIIAGNGGESATLAANEPRGSVTNADFRGKAPAAKLFSVGFLGANDTNLNYTQPTLDSYLQEMPALTNALISNNSWINGGANEYDLSAASYDAAVRDALPGTTGPQPVLFVFAAGNDGGGGALDNGVGGSADTILSPGTAKNVVTVGALEQFRDITNWVTALDGTSNRIWKSETSSSSQVAGYSARGNVGVQTEGTYGRFKPDVVAPGTFVVSTRSQQWDMNAYYDPTNFDGSYSEYYVTVDTNNPAYGFANVPGNASGVTIKVVPNEFSPTPFPTLPIYISTTSVPDPTDPTTYDFSNNDIISIPPDSGGTITDIGSLQNGGFTVAVGLGTNLTTINFDLIITIATTNDNGNELTVLSNLNSTLAPYYRYETGTSMAAPAVSGALALLQDFFTNTLHSTPSPALLKAMVINGARLTTGYNFYGVTNNINYEGWGLVNVPNSVPLALTNTTTSGTNNTVPMYFLDQSPTNALATGDNRVFTVSVPTANARAQQVHITLAWTDPPGNPAAGIKLVNNLDLVVTNNDTGEVFYGNNFVSGQNPHTAASNATNNVADSINNVESVILQSGLGTNYSVSVIGRNVAVNAVTTEQTNIVQDFALVISCGNGSNTNGIAVTAIAPVAPIIAQNITYVSATNGVYYDQIAGANAPWLSTNAVMFGTNSVFTTNANLCIGQTNQWHFFVVTNTTPYTNAAFIIFLPQTLATPREGVFENSTANSTRPEADLDLFVAGPADPTANSLTNLDPVVISNCVYGVNGDQASLTRGGTKFIVYTNAQLNDVFYIGVQCQDQMAADFGFLPIFSQNAFSQLDTNGNQVVTGQLLPGTIPDGNNAHPGHYFVLGLATIPMTVGGLTVSNTIATQNYGDLIGVMTHDSAFATLNNHTGPTDPGTYTMTYNDDGLPNTTHTDGPGSLRDFRGQQALGPWILTEIDDATSATGAITSFTVVIEPHQDLTKKPFQQVTVQPLSWYYGYVDVPVGYTNITVVATNYTIPPQLTPPVQLYLNYNVEPDFNTYLAETNLDSGLPPGNSISYGPPMQPGRYFVGLYNPSSTDSETILLGVTLGYAASAITTVDSASTDTPLPLKDDAVTYDYIDVTNTDLIQNFNVGLRVNHPRISDLVFHLISPDGTRYLLMENRGGQSTNGCGASYTITNVVPTSSNGGSQASTNIIDTGIVPGFITIDYDFFRIPDRMVVYDGTNVLYDTGLVSGSGVLNLVNTASTVISIVMNPGGNTNRITAWKYTAITTQARYAYLTFTEDTNLTATLIKFATPPLAPLTGSNAVVFADDFETYTPGIYSSGFGGWSLLSTNPVNILTNPAAYSGTNFLAISNGVVAITLPTVTGQKYSLSYALGSLSSESGPPTNANWTSTSFSFTAVTNATPLVFAASGTAFTSPANAQTVTVNSNAVIDAVALTEFPPTLFYQPEQDISGLQGTSAAGRWTLETLDNRAGATNAALLSWNLEFQFANTNFVLPPQFVSMPTNVVMIEETTNFVSNPATNPYGTNITLTYSLVDPPAWASIDTNGLITLTPGEADGPTNVAIVTLVTDSHVPPQTITNSFNVTVLESNRPPSLLFPTNTLTIIETIPFNTNAVAIDPDIPTNQLTFALVSATNLFGQVITNLTIDTNGLISWTPDEASGPSTNIIVISVTDTNPYTTTNISPLSYSVTNAFTIILLESNQAPVFNVTNPPDIVMDELTLLTVTNAATDGDIPTNTLTYSVSISVNTAAMNTNGWPLTFATTTPAPSIDPTNGVITWTPSEAQGPGVYTITTIVTDTNPWAFTNNSLSTTNTFNVTVNEVNLAPVPPSIAGTNLFELMTLLVTNTFADFDVPTNALTYVLSVVSTNPADPAVTNATIDTNGVITWTPTEAQGPGVYVFTTFVTDTNLYALTNQTFTASNSFLVTVLETNSAPYWLTNPPATNVIELATLVVTNTALDADIPTNTLTYAVSISVDTNAMATNGWPLNFATTNPPPTIDTNGVITWTPSEAQGPGVYLITTIVTDSGAPPLSATNTFSVTVNETNSAPYWLTNPPATNVNELATLVVTNTALDTDIPTNLLTYTLLVSVDTNAMATNGWPLNFATTNPPPTIDTNGVITWTPSAAQGPGVYTITTIVTDTNLFALTNQSLSATNSFSVTVNEVNTSPYWLTNPPATNVIELATLVVTNTALDADTPTNTLTYAVAISVDTNAMATNGWPLNFATTNPLPTIDTNGVITWTPSEAQGPGVYIITTIVTDTNLYALANQSLSATNSFSVTVLESNQPPSLLFPTNSDTFTILETVPFTTNALAIDLDVPTNQLTFALVSATNLLGQTIDGLTVTTNGLISWTPDETNGPSTNIVLISVTDTNPWAVNQKSFSVTNAFTIVVLESNLPPTLFLPPNTNIDEMVPWTATATATDPDYPTNALTFALVSGPAGLIVLTNGIINWTPDETNGPGDYTIFVSVTDINPWAVNQTSFSVTNSFTIHVNEVNSAPIFVGTPANQTIVALTNLVVTNTATDSDLPTNTLTYTLLTHPSGMTIDSGSGVITWTPTLVQADTTNVITTVVKDSGFPPLSATNFFTVTVSPNPVTSGLLSHWPLNENTGIIAHDVGSANNTGTLTNVGAGTFSWTNGVQGSAVALTNGTTTTVNNGGFITVGNAASLNFESTNTFSLSAWMKVAPGSLQDVTIVGKMIQPAPYTGYEMHYGTTALGGSDNGLTIWIINSFIGNKAIQVSSSIPLNDGNWHQVAFTYDGSGLASGVTIYVDGVADTSTIAPLDGLGTNTIQNNVSFDIGSRDDGAFHNFSGAIDDVQVYNTVLSSNNMLAIYTNPGLAIGPVTPPANFTAASVGTNSFSLQWTAPAYEVFQVQWTTNLAPPSWTVFPELITSTNGVFNFVDTNSASALKFYQLILLP